MDPDKAITAYVAVCQGYPLAAINNAILKFLRGGFEHVSKRFCPTPPELSDMLRDVMPDRPREHQIWPEDVDPVTAAYRAYRAPTPEAKARVAEMKRKFDDGIPVNDEVDRFWTKMEPFWKSGNPAYVGSTKGTPPKPTPKTETELSENWPQPDQKLFETSYMTRGID
jgi:hypothetical protein